MRSSHLRLASAALLFTFVVGLVVAQPFPAAVPAPPGGIAGKTAKDKSKDKDLRPEEDWDLPFAPPYERDATNQLRGAREYLTHKSPPWNTIVPLLQNILNAKSDSFFNIKDKAGTERRTRRISVKTEANRIIAAFPKEGLEFYQQSFGQDAANLLDDAVKHNYDLAMLSDLSQRYFHTRAGAEGTVLLGSLYLERGNYLEAAFAFERLLARPNSDEVLTPRTLFKAALAFKRSGDPRHKSLAQNALDQLHKATLRSGVAIGRKTFSFEQLKAEIDRPVTAIRATYALGEWTGRYGNAQRSGLVDGGPPFLVPAFKPAEMLVDRHDSDRPANDWIRENLLALFDRDNAKNMLSLPLPGFFPVSTPDMVIFRSYDGVHAVATRDHTVVLNGEPKLVRAGELKWISSTELGVHDMYVNEDTQIKDTMEHWWAQYKTPAHQAQSLLYENPMLGALAHDGQYVYFIDDVAVPPPPARNDPNFGFNSMPTRQNGVLADAARASILVSVQMNSGSQNWTLGRVHSNPKSPPPPLPLLTEEQADKCTDAFHLCLHAVFLGPPLPLNGRLYVLIELDGAVRLLCLDPKHLVPAKDWHLKVPELIWSQKLGRPNQAIAGDSLRRFQGAFLTAGEGILICPTNSGVVVGVDIMSRSLLWAHAYRKLENKQPTVNRMTGMMEQPGMKLDPYRWRASAPIVSGGRVVLSSFDSPNLECLDVRTGRLLWSTRKLPEDLYVGGVVDDKVIVVSKSAVRAYHLFGEDVEALAPKPAWVDENKNMKATPLLSAVPTGHGIASKSAFYLPVRPEHAGRGTVPPAEIWAINLETGAVMAKTAARLRKDGYGSELRQFGLGNLVFQDGLVIAQSAFEVAVYPQLEVKKAEMDRLLAANPKDPKGLFNRGELYLDDGKIAAAIADFKEAEQNNPPDELKPSIKDKLYVAYTELLRDKFPQGEKYLKEYEQLCEVPIEADLEPFEKKRREDDTLRRKRLYYSLLAKGREDQKRLGEAFDLYLKLASLGEGRTLAEMPDEPSVRIRPDVWARGRIEAMIRRATDPAARRSLEDRVNAEWRQVAAKNDRDDLQKFVDVFGPYFPAGFEAQLKLSELLMQSGNEDDSREAQVLLSQLRASVEVPSVRARATEALARMMVKNQLMEDAVGLYLQLGKEFPSVVVRDGKTGADYLTDLLTDRRLLPYLEPARYPLPPRVKAEVNQQQYRNNMGAAFEVEPEGDLFPMYRRLRFSIDMVSSGNGTWFLIAQDRTTGVERRRYRDIYPPMQYNPGNWPSARHLQACGHLLLLQVGHWMYCLDLADNKERWRKNLLGNNVNLQANQIVDNGQGDVYVQFVDLTRQQIGRIAVLQPGYVAILSREGLEVCEPTTRKQLWMRRNVGDKLHVYGDSRYIMLVDLNENRKPVGTRLVRAVDGMSVDGSKDLGATLAAARSYRILGRTVLLHESSGAQQTLRLFDAATGKDVWKREYDAKSVELKSMNLDWTGFVKSNGEVDLLEVATGKPVVGLKLDAKYGADHLKGCVEAQLHMDAERFYLVLDRSSRGAPANRRMGIYNYTLQTHPVNGPLYAFDRATGKQLWWNDHVFENQWLIMDRFAELPVLIAAAPVPEKNGAILYRVVVVEKLQGNVRLNKGLMNNGNFFHHLIVDQKNGDIELHRFDVRVRITKADAPNK